METIRLTDQRSRSITAKRRLTERRVADTSAT